MQTEKIKQLPTIDFVLVPLTAESATSINSFNLREIFNWQFAISEQKAKQLTFVSSLKINHI